MKIFKVTLDPSNPVEKIVKVPIGSNYGIQINWNYEKYPTFVGTDINTENGFLTDSLGKIKENTSFTEVNGQKIFTDLHVIEEVGNTIILYYGKNETYDANKLDNFGSIKVVGVDTDDYDVDVGGGDATIEGISYENNELTLSAQTISLTGDVMINGEEYQSGSSFEYITETDNTVNINANTYIKSPDNKSYTYYVNGGICTDSNGCIWICADTTYIKGKSDVRIFSYGEGMGMTIQSSGDIKLNSGTDYKVYINGEEYQAGGGSSGGSIEGLYNDEGGYGIGSIDLANIAIGNLIGDTSLSSINIGGNCVALRTDSSYLVLQNNTDINMATMGDITMFGGGDNSNVNICSQTINLNGTVYINGVQYQGGGSSVDYIYSVENQRGDNCINLFIGNNRNEPPQFNDRVYINGCNIIIGSEMYFYDGNNEWTSGNGTNNLCLKATNLDFCIDTNNDGCWKINGYRINLDQFLSQFGEYVG